MKNLKFLLLLLVVIFSSVALTSCLGDDDDDEGSNCTTELQKAADNYIEKANAISANPTKANCLAWKDAARVYYEKAKECGDEQTIDYIDQLLEIVEGADCNALD